MWINYSRWKHVIKYNKSLHCQWVSKWEMNICLTIDLQMKKIQLQKLFRGYNPQTYKLPENIYITFRKGSPIFWTDRIVRFFIFIMKEYLWSSDAQVKVYNIHTHPTRYESQPSLPDLQKFCINQPPEPNLTCKLPALSKRWCFITFWAAAPEPAIFF